ncbi:hypothetical protein M407DRAFT_242492 [Tulasnella calospora MUT 4182]|uniref:Uncharacterized protein n=1 Tax=Tulasnella calospora MUT 4182 TaxID=1051891 RepID=A0A0C3QNL7_9AGAM|nr:hypothetical protein M407DRAFT_242492 [Tulasnella calospora MUT 4182]
MEYMSSKWNQSMSLLPGLEQVRGNRFLANPLDSCMALEPTPIAFQVFKHGSGRTPWQAGRTGVDLHRQLLDPRVSGNRSPNGVYVWRFRKTDGYEGGS